MTEPVAAGSHDELGWGDLASQRECARAVLRHHLDAEPNSDNIEAFIVEIAAEWEDGQPWLLYRGDLAGRLGL